MSASVEPGTPRATIGDLRRLARRAGSSPLGGLAVDLLAHMRTPRFQADIWRDYVQTRRAARFLRSGCNASKEHVALVAAFGTIGAAKQEGLLAAALRRRGWLVTSLTSRAWPWSRRYQAALGLDRQQLRQQLRTESAVLTASADAARSFLAGNAGFREIKGWVYRGARIGPALLSGIQRAQRLGSPDPSDPAIRVQMDVLLPRLLAWVHQANQLLDRTRPRLLYLIEANDWNSPLVDLAIERGIDVIQTVQPIRDDALVFKRLNRETRRYHANSVAAATMGQLADKPWTDACERALEQEFADRYGGRWFLQGRNQPGTRAKSRSDIQRQLGLDPAKKICVVFSHILWDANLFYGEDLFEDYADWLVQTVRAATRNPALNWIVKLHPANIWKRAFEQDTGELAEVVVLRRHGLLPLPGHVKLVMPETDISTLSLFQSVDYGITVRGTAGIELPCFGVPTLTAGTGRYSGLGFTRDFSSREDYLAALDVLHVAAPMTVEETIRAKHHAFALFRHRPWVFKSFRSTFRAPGGAAHPLSYNFELVVRSWQEIERNGDLDGWADWATDCARPVDYLASG